VPLGLASGAVGGADDVAAAAAGGGVLDPLFELGVDLPAAPIPIPTSRMTMAPTISTRS